MDYIQENGIKRLAEKCSTEEVMICIISKRENSTLVLGGARWGRFHCGRNASPKDQNSFKHQMMEFLY